MAEKYAHASGYTKESLELVHQVCLYVATKLGDLLNELVVVGGLVPSLLIPPESLTEDQDAHVGTVDLDLGLSIAILDERRYEDLTDRLDKAGFKPDLNEEGNNILQRWKYIHKNGLNVTIDFLIPASLPTDKGGRLRHIESDFAAIITPGLEMAFQDKRKIQLNGLTMKGEKAKRDIWVCGPASFILLKALAFDSRGENKDAYDLYYTIRNYGQGIDDIIGLLQPLLSNKHANKALSVLKRDFYDQDSIGPSRVAQFLYDEVNDELQADVAGFVRELLGNCGFG